MRLPIIHSKVYVAPLTTSHRFPMAKFSRLIELLIEDGVTSWEYITVPDPAPINWLHLAHCSSYVTKVITGTLERDGIRRIGLPLSDALILRSRSSIGGTVLTARMALTHGLACNTAGGSHHAFSTHGAGFCIFNDVAIAIRLLQREGLIHRALVIDLDVHQGDGTAEIFSYDSTTYTFSMHCAENFPANKQTSDLDVELPAHTGDHAYLAHLAQNLETAISEARPDLVFFNAGVDPHREDKLGLLNLTDNGLKERERMVLSTCRKLELPVACVIGGGYSDDIDGLAQRHSILHHTATHLIA